jgi:hypothetical protein
MKHVLLFIFSIILFSSQIASAQAGNQNQSGYTEREKTQQAIEQNRKEVQQAGEANKPNESSAPTTFNATAGMDSNVRVTLDHRSLVYGTIIENGSNMMGGKITSGFSFGYYKDPNSEKWRLLAGLELPAGYITNSLLYYVGGGAQLGRKGDKTTLYLNAGIDHRMLSWLKLQYGLNWVVGGNFGLNLSAGLTF